MEIVRCEFTSANVGGELLDDVPDQLFRQSFARDPACAAHTAKETNGSDTSCRGQLFKRPVTQSGTGMFERDRLPAEVHNCPVPFALLKDGRRSAQRARAAEARRRAEGQEAPDHVCLPSAHSRVPAIALVPDRRSTVAKPHSQFLYTLDSPYPGSQVCAEEPDGNTQRKLAPVGAHNATSCAVRARGEISFTLNVVVMAGTGNAHVWRKEPAMK